MASASYRRPSILNRIPRDNHALIEASAGTGKTHTIEHLVLDLLLENSCSIEEILAVTFTEKATVELRGRIRALLEAVLSGRAGEKRPADDEERPLGEDDLRNLGTALFSFDRAPIFTIHGFCQRILTELAFESGARFQLEVVDGRRAFRRAFRAEVRERLAVEDGARELLMKRLGGGDSSARESLVDSIEQLLYEAQVHRYLDSPARADNEAAIAALAEAFEADALTEAYQNLRAPARDNAFAAVKRLSGLIRKARKKPDGLHSALDESAFGGLPEIEKVEKAFKSGKLPKRTRELLELIDKCRIASSLEVKVVDAFLPRVAERLSRDKLDNGEIDYDDMLAWVWRALGGAGGDALVSALRARFRYALVDEFQDTDDLQWKIFRRLFVESAGQSCLYVVGDPKQAIYAFRGADVFAYLQARKELVERRGVKPVALIDNFRSTADCIDACNLILDRNANPPIFSGEIQYDTPVRCGRPELRALDADGKPVKPVTLMRYARSAATPAPARRLRAAMGRHIASAIRAILSDPPHRIVIAGKSDAPEPVQANEIFVLTRSGSESLEIGRYLREAGVPFAFYKQEGLFQTEEASDILDVLRAIEAPAVRSRQLKAWASPFFAVPFASLFGMGEVPADHPMNERLFEWRALAQQERFAELFDRLLHESGLANRELFLANSERELTNYQHIFEILLADAMNERLSLAEIIARLQSYIGETALPPGLNGNLQRIESERRAVQVMTVHMSKGLEADLVFLFGGTGAPRNRSKVAVYHDGGERRLVIRSAATDSVKQRLREEQEQEDQRLIYVALSRARAKLYLPVFPEKSARVTGYYTRLNQRLNALLSAPDSRKLREKLFAAEDVLDAGAGAQRAGAGLDSILNSWSLPENLLREDRDGEAESVFARLCDAHRAMLTRSYTALQRTTTAGAGAPEPEDFKYPVDAAAEAPDLAGGRNVGIFLHEAIQKLDLNSLAEPIGLAAWKSRDGVRSLFADAMRRHRVTDPRWLERGPEIVFNALKSPIAIPGGAALGPLYKCPSVREMEFVYPIPEAAHPLLGSAREGEWRVERGYLKGFVDFVFEQDGLTYFADWKSDQLASYGAGAIEAHAGEHYALQAKIYSVGVVRLLRIRNQEEYNARFGGLLYLFIRGMRYDGNGKDGVYFHRPEWDEIVRYEDELMRAVAPLWSAQ